MVDMTRLDRSGPGSAGSDGHLLFAVTHAVQTSATGFLNSFQADRNAENILNAALWDLTAAKLLFEST
jgi:hypothetical protein